MKTRANIIAVALGAAIPLIGLTTGLFVAPAVAQDNVTYYFYCAAAGNPNAYYGSIFSHRSRGYADTEVSNTTAERIRFRDLVTGRGYRIYSDASCQGPYNSYREAADARQSGMASARQNGMTVIEF